MKEFNVQTTCGRNFIWSAIDMESLLLELTFRGYRATRIVEHNEKKMEASA